MRFGLESGGEGLDGLIGLSDAIIFVVCDRWTCYHLRGNAFVSFVLMVGAGFWLQPACC